MATNISVWASAGLRCNQIGARVNNLFTGFDKLTTADTGEMSGMRHLLGAVSASAPLPGTNMVYPRSDDGYLGGFAFEGQPSTFAQGFEATDLDALAFLAKKALYTLGLWDILNSGNSNVQFQDCVQLMAREAQSHESTADGDSGFDNLMVLSNKFRRERGDMGFQTVGANTLNGTAARVKKTPWNAAISSLFTGDSDGLTWEWWSQYPCTMFTFIGDGTITAIPLPYTPVDAASIKLFNGSTGNAIAVTSASVGGKTATVGAAPASGLPVIGIMETPDL